MKAVVAGGAGFIGSNLCDTLLARGDDVACLDNFVTGRPQNIEHLRKHPRFSFVEHDLTDGLPSIERPDAIFHLASPASPPGYQRHSIETLRVNSLGTEHLLKLAASTGASFL